MTKKLSTAKKKVVIAQKNDVWCAHSEHLKVMATVQNKATKYN